MDLNELSTPWAIIMQHYRNGKRIEKADIVAALESDAPVPAYVKPLLSEIISGEYRFVRGLKPDARFDRMGSRMLAELVDVAEAAFNSGWADYPEAPPELKERAHAIRKKLRGAGTSRESAKEAVAGWHGISVRKLEKILSGAQ